MGTPQAQSSCPLHTHSSRPPPPPRARARAQCAMHEEALWAGLGRTQLCHHGWQPCASGTPKSHRRASGIRRSGRKGKAQKHTAAEIAGKHAAAKYAAGAAGGGAKLAEKRKAVGANAAVVCELCMVAQVPPPPQPHSKDALRACMCSLAAARFYQTRRDGGAPLRSRSTHKFACAARRVRSRTWLR